MSAVPSDLSASSVVPHNHEKWNKYGNVATAVAVVSFVAMAVFIGLCVALPPFCLPFFACAAIGTGLLFITSLSFAFYCDWQNKKSHPKHTAEA